jgi:hypothetical protein
MKRRTFWILTLLLLGLGLLLHWPGGVSFKSDDYPAIRYASDFGNVLQDFAGPQYDLRFLVLYRPLITLSLWVDYQLFGVQPLGYLLMNVLAFLSSVLVLMQCLRLLLGESVGRVAGLLLGAWWILHPVVPVSLQWVVGRVDTHVALPMLLACWMHLRVRRGARMWPVWVFSVLALMSKESAFGLPLLLLGLDFLDERAQGRGLSLLGRRLQALPLLLLLPAVLALRYVLLGTMVGGYSFQAAAGFDLLGILEGLFHVVAVSVQPSWTLAQMLHPLVFGVLVWGFCLAALVFFCYRGFRLHWARLIGLSVLLAGLYGPLAQALPAMRDSFAPRLAYLACLAPLAIVAIVVAPVWTRAHELVHGNEDGRRAGPILLTLLLLMTYAGAQQELKRHEGFNRELVAASRQLAKSVPAPLPIVLSGDAELANHPQRFLWGLGSVLEPPFHRPGREVVTLRKMHQAAAEVPVEELGLPGFVHVETISKFGDGSFELNMDPREGAGDAPALSYVEPVGFDGVMRAELQEQVYGQPLSVGWPVGPGWDGRVHVLTSVGSFTLRIAGPDAPGLAEGGFLSLLQVLAADVTWQAKGAALPAYLLLWNPGDLSRGSPFYLFWREGEQLRYATLVYGRSFIQTVYEASKGG